MKALQLARTTLLSTAIALTMAGCGEEAKEMTQEEIQYISHLDQARFFQRQGELKASTLEARSAIELQADQPDPYFVILENLLKAGDAENAERQLDQLLDAMEENETEISQANQTRASLIRAEANFYQRDFKEALRALSEASFGDRAKELKGKILEAKIYHASGETDKARAAFESAQEIDTNSPLPLIGLSRLAFSEDNQQAVDQYLAEAEKLDPQEPELWLWKGQLAQAREQWEAAEEAYIKALEDIGQFDVMTRRKYETISALISVLRAQGKSSEAFVYEEILAKSGPGMVRSNLIAAQDAYNRGDLNEAAKYLEEILRQAPSHEQSNLMLGMIRFRQGRVEEAEKLLAPIAEMTHDSEASRLLAATRLQLKDPEGAKSVLEDLDDSDSNPATLALAGIAALSTGDQDTGEALIQKSLQQNPDNHELRIRYARYLIEIGRFDDAIKNANTVKEAAPDNESARAVLIQAYLRSEQPTKAVSVADQWIKDSPDSMTAILTRGQLALEAGEQGEAQDYFERARKAFPESTAPLVALGNLAMTQDKSDNARALFRTALELNADNRAALAGFSRVSSQDAVLELVTQLSEDQPDAVGPKLVLLEAALTNGDNTQADSLSATLLERTEENVPSAAEPAVINIYSAVSTRLRKSNPEQAKTVLDRARVLFPESERVSLQAADLAFQSGDESEARNIIQEAKQAHPDSANPYLIEATFYEQEGEFRQAAELYELALTKDDSANTHVAYIRTLQKDGRKDSALKAAAAALESYPSNPTLLMNAAMLYQNEQQTEKAKSAYEALLDITSDNVVALNNLAWLYHEEGDARAMELAGRAYELNPENAAIADTYGWILLKAGKAEESLPVLEKAYKLQPNSDEIAMHLAEAYKATGKNAEAKVILEGIGERG
ncbi:MAG: tetratricopeptide repeat protein [Gammaproteobacteria bacterium]|nr:MAG: tetratricopeptide repeat protein [Gammaproteobacteria bacterium]